MVSEQEKEKIIEVLLSQERVLTLLYDKTFPPRQAMQGRIIARNSQKNLGMGLGIDDSVLRQFNYN